jgi:hypothetical protein
VAGVAQGSRSSHHEGFAAEPNGGLLVVPVLPEDSYQMLHRVAAQHRLPAIHSNRGSAAAYVDRILRGTKVSELPV